MLLGTLMALVAIPLFLVLHIGAYRLVPATRKMSRQKLVVVVVLLAAVAVTGFTFAKTIDPFQSAHTFLLTGLFGMIYFHWFNMSETARRIRILVRYVAFQEAPAVETSEQSSQRIFANRIVRMREMNTIRQVNGKFVLQPGPLLYAARLILFWRSLFFPQR